MPHFSQFTVLDRTGEKSVHEFNNDAITAVSLPGFLTDFAAYRTALDNLILGTVQQESWIGDRTVLSNVLPTNNFAQRELKLLIRYQSIISGRIWRLEIPTPDLANLTLENNDYVTLDDGGLMAAWVSAFVTLASPPDDPADGVIVMDARIVGRNI